MTCMHACKFLPDTKTADYIQITLERILTEAGLDAENVPCTTDKDANMAAARHTNAIITVHVTVYPFPLIQGGKFLVIRVMIYNH